MATTIHKWRSPTPLPQIKNLVTIVYISDTQPQLPNGNLLLHAGDLFQSGSFAKIQAQPDWLNTQPHKHEVIIAGNHHLLLNPLFVNRFPERILERPGSSCSDLQ